MTTSNFHIETFEYVSTKKYYQSKYAAFFDRLQPGQRLRVPIEVLGTVSKALATYLRQRGQDPKGRIKTERKVKDAQGNPLEGEGAIYLLPEKPQSSNERPKTTFAPVPAPASKPIKGAWPAVAPKSEKKK